MPEANDRPMLLPTPARKTSRPDPRSADIRRGRLLAQLLREPRDLTLIQAAAGSGKTVLAAQLADELRNPVAWVTLDSTDNDPVVLISTVMDSLSRAGLDGSWQDTPLTSDDPTYGRIVLPYFRIRLESQPVPVTLVLDDAHEVSSAEAVTLLETILASLPPGSHGIVIGRTLNRLPVAAWIANDAAVLLAGPELAMDSEEVTELVSRFGDGTPDRATVDDLIAATQGWPIAVYLASRSADPAQVGTRSYFGDYLDDEVLGDADAQTVRFLKATSPLLDLSGELCDDVLESEGSGEILDRADRASLLVTRSRDHDWFRLHPLVREHLQERLRLEDPNLFRNVTRRASRWSLTAGHTDRAIAYARLSGDTDLLGTTIWEAAGEALITGQSQRVVTWLGTVDDATIAKSYPLALAASWCAINRGQTADAHRWGQAVFASIYEGWQSNLSRSSVEAGVALLLSTNGSLGYQPSAELAAEAMRSLPDGHVTTAFAQMITGWMQALAGDWDQGIENLRGAALRAHSEGLIGTEVETKALLSVALLSRGDNSGADALVREALDAWEQRGISHFLVTGALINGSAMLLAARSGQTERAKTLLLQSQESVTKFGSMLPWLAVVIESFAAAAHAYLGDQPQAGRHLAAAATLSQEVHQSPLLADLVQGAQDTVESEFQLADLSPAERRVFDLLLTRATLREIADSLFVSPETVKTQTASVYRKLRVSSRREVQELGDRLHASPISINS
ncbi:MAG: LuxR C-terminal-related transcriptional regulator [Candidatus Nanopelagicales bacterium]